MGSGTVGRGVLALVPVNVGFFPGLCSVVWQFMQVLGAGRGAALGSRGSFSACLSVGIIAIGKGVLTFELPKGEGNVEDGYRGAELS